MVAMDMDMDSLDMDSLDMDSLDMGGSRNLRAIINVAMNCSLCMRVSN